jgi:hypothetical protein
MLTLTFPSTLNNILLPAIGLLLGASLGLLLGALTRRHGERRPANRVAAQRQKPLTGRQRLQATLIALCGDTGYWIVRWMRMRALGRPFRLEPFPWGGLVNRLFKGIMVGVIAAIVYALLSAL